MQIFVLSEYERTAQYGKFGILCAQLKCDEPGWPASSKGPRAPSLYFGGDGFISQLASFKSLKTHSGNDNPEKEEQRVGGCSGEASMYSIHSLCPWGRLQSKPTPNCLFHCWASFTVIRITNTPSWLDFRAETNCKMIKKHIRIAIESHKERQIEKG